MSEKDKKGFDGGLRKLCLLALGVGISCLPVVNVFGEERQKQDIPSTAKVVRTEALRPNNGPEGRPLPLAAHWHMRHFLLEEQFDMLKRGHHILPFIYLVGPGIPDGRLEKRFNDLLPGFHKLARWKMPFVMITGGQWEAAFYQSRYRDVPVEETGCAVDLDGERMNKVSPFSPVEPWRKLGREWTGSEYVRTLEDIYPDPPLVIMASNNEAKDLRWHDVEKSGRYMEKYGGGRSDNFKRKVVGDGWIERYSALIEGMRAGLDSEAWQENSYFVAYGGIGPNHMGREPGWARWSSLTDDRLSINPFMWEGVIAEAYDNPWQVDKFDHHAWSCQVEMMNTRFMRDQALEINPDFWHELIFWDGGKSKQLDYEKRGLAYPPERYVAWARYV
ncbi:MAG: hypothetical protein ACOC0A_03265, partial [Planctomycetota bacterium]